MADRKRVTLDGTESGGWDAVWWTKKDEEIGAEMVKAAQKYQTALQSRYDLNRRFTQLDKGQILPTSMLDAGSPRSAYQDFDLCWNVVQASRNTAKSVIVRNRVRVTFQSEGNDFETQEIIKQAETYVQGTWFGNRVYEELDGQWFDDGATTGMGILRVEPENGDVVISRVMPDCLIYNEFEALKGSVRQLFIVDWCSTWEAIAKYATDKDGKVDGAKKAAILECATSPNSYAYQMPGDNGAQIRLVPVYIGWYLPSRRGAKDGVRVVGVPGTSAGATLGRREYKWTKFPLAFFRPERSPAGIWGIGTAERVAGFQYRLNELNYQIVEAGRLGSMGKWLRETGSGVNPADLTNEYGGVIDYTATKPEHVTIDGIPRGLLEERDATYQQAFKELGLSEWTVGGVQPNNIESGEGLQQLREQEQGRAVPCGQEWEGDHVTLAELTIYAACDAFEENKELSVYAQNPDGDGLQKINFSKIAKLMQDPDAWQVRPYPTSILPASPTAKFEKLRKWRAAGDIDEETFLALSELPDTMKESNILLAGVKACKRAISNIQRKGTAGYEPPDPAMPLAYGIKIAHSSYLAGLGNGMDDERLSLLLSWIDDARALSESSQMAGAQPGAAPGAPGDASSGAPPPGAPGAPPLPGDAAGGLPPPGPGMAPELTGDGSGPDTLPPAA